MVIINIIGIIIVVLAAAGIVTLWEDLRNKNRGGISFKESMDLTELPVVTFKIGDGKLNFLLDTGSNTSHINQSVLPKIPYNKTNACTEVIGMEGNPVKVNIVEITLQYKDNEYSDLFNVTNLDTAFSQIKKESGVTIHGILGSKFFEKYNYVLDFNELIAYSKHK